MLLCIFFSVGELKSMTFGIPMRWLDPIKHDVNDCYVCKNKEVFNLNRYNRNSFVYEGVPSALLPVLHSDELPVPTLPAVRRPRHFMSTTMNTASASYSEYVPTEVTTRRKLISQEHLYALVRKMNLSKAKAEILAADLKSVDFLEPGVNVTGFRTRQSIFMPYFTANEDNTFVYCNDVNGLITEMNIHYKAEEWRLFIDSSKRGLKAVLLYVDNTKASIPIAYAINKSKKL